MYAKPSVWVGRAEDEKLLETKKLVSKNLHEDWSRDKYPQHLYPPMVSSPFRIDQAFLHPRTDSRFSLAQAHKVTYLVASTVVVVSTATVLYSLELERARLDKNHVANKEHGR